MQVYRGELAVSQQVAQEIEDAVRDAVRAPGAPKALVHLWSPPQPQAPSPGDVIGLPRLSETWVINGNGRVL